MLSEVKAGTIIPPPLHRGGFQEQSAVKSQTKGLACITPYERASKMHQLHL